jgi:hypothetical protein
MKSGVNPVAMAEFCLALQTKARSRLDLVELVGVNRNTVSRWLDIYYDRKMVFVERYHCPVLAGKPVAMWRWGYMQKDADYPVPMTQAERDRRRRLRNRGFNPGDMYVDTRKLPGGGDAGTAGAR